MKVSHDLDPKLCILCQKGKRWRGPFSVWCQKCVRDVCCKIVGKRCIHRDLRKGL